jgi:hypothetical protein
VQKSRVSRRNTWATRRLRRRHTIPPWLKPATSISRSLNPPAASRVYLGNADAGAKLIVDKTPLGQLAGVLTFVTLDDAQAAKLRDALSEWLKRNDPPVEIIAEPPPR